ncbi:MAG TPA: 7-cyano-7-deazaguanine synthase [Candidatus Binataceae bacterium]|nr:7-cyano-7-deazaguanine synthase [Candidatus Binataceae bacterium]
MSLADRDYRIVPLKRRLAVLASGGLDSSVMLADLARRGREVFPVYIRAGLLWERHELPALRRFVARLGMSNVHRLTVLELPMRDVAGSHWTVTGRRVPGYKAALSSNYILGRNLSLLAKAAVFCAHNRIGAIAMAPLESNPFPDARPEFFRAVERAVRLGAGLPLRVLTPYVGMTKADVILRGAGLPLEFTMSCARPQGGRHCGACTKCAERIEAFRAAAVADPTDYIRRPPPR